MQKGQELYHQRIIDELSTKLNGEILSKLIIFFAFFIFFSIFWLFIVYIFFQKISFNSARTIIGSIKENNYASYAANFLVPVEIPSQFSIEDKLPIKLLGISNSKMLFLK